MWTVSNSVSPLRFNQWWIQFHACYFTLDIFFSFGHIFHFNQALFSFCKLAELALWQPPKSVWHLFPFTRLPHLIWPVKAVSVWGELKYTANRVKQTHTHRHIHWLSKWIGNEFCVTFDGTKIHSSTLTFFPLSHSWGVQFFNDDICNCVTYPCAGFFSFLV